MHLCFSCGYKGNLYVLVRDLLDLDHGDILKFLEDREEVPLDVLAKRLSDLPQYVSSDDTIPMSEARLAGFTSPPEWGLKSRAINAEAAELYGVLWDEENSNWILPLREPYFYKLMGWQEKGSRSRFFRNYPAGIKKSTTLFGVDVQREDTAILVESPLDCLRLYTAGFKGAVASCGAMVSAEQVKLLKRSETVVVAMDNPRFDEAGKKACEEIRLLAKKYGVIVKYFNYGDFPEKDPGDMTDEQIAWGIANSKDMILGSRAYL